VAELVTLVRDLQAQLVATAGATTVWQERCRVLTDQLALAAPASSQQPQEPTLDASTAMRAQEPPPWPSRLWGRSWAVDGAMTLVAVLLGVLRW
jgi:hypothetical protein